MDGLTFLEALKVLKEKGNGFRAHPANRPGILIWFVSDFIESNFPVRYDDYFGQWCVVQDDTVIR
jgi:hypothetical protein